MDVIDLGCAVLRTAYFESFMAVASYFGHGSVGSVVGLLLLAHGYAYDNQRTKRAGIAVLVALIVAGIAVQVLKEVVQWLRPTHQASHGFPSSRTSAAFALASVLTVSFPALGPLFYFLAVLTALSRLYFRAHFTWDVIGGAVIGLMAGIPAASKLITRSPPADYGLMRFATWAGVAAVGVAGLAFFYSMEKTIGLHMVVADPARNTQAVASFDFGAPETRNFLLYGWSGDEQWLDGKQSVVWANGLASELTMNLPAVQDYRFRLHVFPYSPSGPACQAVEVKVNDSKVSLIFLEQGWHSYEFTVPKTTTRAGHNSIQFFYNYAESPKSRRRSPDERFLSVAFDRLDVLSAR